MKNKKRIFFVIKVSAAPIAVPYPFFSLAEHNELALTVNRRLCSIFSERIARFKSELKANRFLEKVKKKPFWDYEIGQISEWVD